MNARALSKGLVLILSLVVIGFVVRSTELDSAFSKTWIDSDIRGHGLEGEILFYLICAAAASVGLPRQMISFLAGYAFGLITGSLLALAATVTGCIIAFYYARFLGREFVATRFPRRIRAIDSFLHDNPFTMTLLIRFLPVGSNLVTNLAAGVSSVGAVPFFFGSGFGYIPQTVIFALVGSGVTLQPELRISVGALLFVVSGFLGVYLYRRYRHGKHLDAETERQIDVGD